MRNLSDSLAGRITIIELPSLSAREIVAFQGEPISRESLLDMIWRGGFPELYSTQRNPERFFASYIASYIERDIKQMINVRQERDFDRFLRLCALRAGSLTALNPLAAELGISPTTAKAWFDALVASHVIALAEPFHSNLSKRLIKTPKFYFTDTGLQCALAGLRSKEELQNSSLLGAIFEGHCFGQIHRSFQNRALRPRVSFFRDHVGHEIDFVIELGNESHLIECKWSDTPNWSQKNFAKAEEYIQTGRRVTRSVACSTIHERHTDGGVTIRNSLDWEWLHA